MLACWTNKDEHVTITYSQAHLETWKKQAGVNQSQLLTTEHFYKVQVRGQFIEDFVLIVQIGKITKPARA